MQSEAEQAFQDYVSSRWNALVRTAYLLTGDRHLAEDLVQSTLAKAYRSWPRVRRGGDPDAHVRRMLVTCHHDRFRRTRVAEHLTDVPPERTTEQDDMARADERHVLARALADLPKRQRTVVVLRYWEDLSEAEVARTMGCSVGTVKSQSAKALAKLRNRLGPSRLTPTG